MKNRVWRARHPASALASSNLLWWEKLPMDVSLSHYVCDNRTTRAGRQSMLTCGAGTRSTIDARALRVIDRVPKPRAADGKLSEVSLMKSGRGPCASAAASSSALGTNRRKITHTSTSIWARPVTSSAPIALRYSVSIRAWVRTKLIRQIVLMVTWSELKNSNTASLIMQAAANQRHRPAFGAVHDNRERSGLVRMQASRRPNQR